MVQLIIVALHPMEMNLRKIEVVLVKSLKVALLKLKKIVPQKKIRIILKGMMTSEMETEIIVADPEVFLVQDRLKEEMKEDMIIVQDGITHARDIQVVALVTVVALHRKVAVHLQKEDLERRREDPVAKGPRKRNDDINHPMEVHLHLHRAEMSQARNQRIQTQIHHSF